MNFYFHPDPASDLTLSQEESSHAVKVLRKKTGDSLLLMDGKGGKYEAEITDANFRKCQFRILKKEHIDPKEAQIHIGIAPTKNIDRLEWFVEKACELGIDQITIFISQHTERKKVKLERLEKKAISAMKQSKSFWKCQIHWADKFQSLVSSVTTDQRFIAYVETGEESALKQLLQPEKDTMILIGPEGDFSPEEIKTATMAGFTAVNLGKNVLRTETAGIIAAHTFNLINGW